MKTRSCRKSLWWLFILLLVVTYGCDDAKSQGKDDTLLSAIENADFDTAQRILTQNPHLIDNHIDGQNSLLHVAVYNDNEDLLRFLLANGAAVDAVTQQGQSTPLHDAAAQGNYNMARILLEHGADVNYRDDFLNTPLHKACSLYLTATKEMVGLLLDYGAEVDARTARGETPLCLACQWLQEDKEGLEIIRLLLENGADPNTMCFYDVPDLSLMHLTISGGRNYKKAQLLIDYGATLELKTDEGMRSFTIEEVKVLYQQLEASQNNSN